MITRVNTRSTAHTGNLVIPANKNRSLFAVFQTSGAGTIEFGGGGGKIPLSEGGSYLPYISPTDEISIETVGSFVIHLAGQTI